MTSVAGHDWSSNWSFYDWLPDPATSCSCQSCKILTGNWTGSYQSWAKMEKVQSQPDFQTLESKEPVPIIIVRQCVYFVCRATVLLRSSRRRKSGFFLRAQSGPRTSSTNQFIDQSVVWSLLSKVAHEYILMSMGTLQAGTLALRALYSDL